VTAGRAGTSASDAPEGPVSQEDAATRRPVTFASIVGSSSEAPGTPLVLLEFIERQHADRRRAEGKGVLGAKAVRRRHPHSRPEKLKHSPAPRFHAATKEARRALADAYREFMAAFREAAELLKIGDPEPGFPPGSFPPGMPYVPHQAPG